MRRTNDFLYVRLYKTLKEQILTGLIKPGEYLMPESEMYAHYGMSRNSVRKALEKLQNEGLIIKRVGSGSFVPADLNIRTEGRQILRVITPFPAYVVDYGLSTICDLFRRKYPNVDINILSLPADSFSESIRRTERLGVKPDLILLTEGQFHNVESHSSFINVEPVIGEYIPSIYDRLLQPFRYKNELKAAPITFTPVCLVYNPELFAHGNVEQPGTHWQLDHFIQAAKRLTTIEEGLISRYGFSFVPTLSRWPVFALQNGYRPNVANHRQIIAKALHTLQDLLHRQRVATTYSIHTNLVNPFIYGKSAMSLTTLFEMSSWKERGIEFQPEIAPLPFGEVKSTLLQTNALMIPKQAENSELAMDFIKLAIHPDTQKEMCLAAPFLSVMEPVNRIVRSPLYLQTLLVHGDDIDQHFFQYELFDQDDLTELSAEMSLFWLGLENAEAVAAQFP